MKMFNLKKKSKSKGFTLIEILLVVGFIALAGIGVYVVYNKVQTSNAANTEVRNLDTLRAGVKNIYAGSTNYGTAAADITATLVNAKVAPDSMVNGAALRSSWGGGVTAAVTGFGTGTPTPTNNAFSITYLAVPADICAKFVTVGGASFNKVVIGTGEPVKDTSASTGNTINVAETALQCSAGNVSVTFTSL